MERGPFFEQRSALQFYTRHDDNGQWPLRLRSWLLRNLYDDDDIHNAVYRRIKHKHSKHIWNQLHLCRRNIPGNARLFPSKRYRQSEPVRDGHQNQNHFIYNLCAELVRMGQERLHVQPSVRSADPNHQWSGLSFASLGIHRLHRANL